MASLADAPPFVAALSTHWRKQIMRQCDGDWNRVTQDADGSITVHNQPQPIVAEATRPGYRDPQPPPARDPLPAIGTRLMARPQRVDTSTFTRTELPPVLAPKKRAPKKKKDTSRFDAALVRSLNREAYDEAARALGANTIDPA